MNVEKVDYLKKYNLFNGVLLLWLLFLPLKNAIYQASTIILVFMFIYHVFYFKNKDKLINIIFKYKDILIAMMLLFVSMLLSSIFGVNSFESFSITIKFLYRYVLLFLLLLYFHQLGFFNKKNILTMIIISLSVYGLDGLYQYFSGYDFFKNLPLMGDGLTGPLFNRNIFGLIMAIEANIIIYLLLNSSNNIGKIFYGVFLSLIVFLLLHSLSRSSWLFFFIFSFLLLSFMIKNTHFSKKNLFIGFLLFFTFTFIFIIQNDVLIERFEQLLSADSSGRWPVWVMTFEAVKSSLIFGYGVDSYIYTIKDTVVVGVHNVTLEILLYLGIVGLSVYIYFFIKIFQEVYKSKNYVYGFFLFAFLFALQFDGSLVNSKLDLSILVLIMFFIYSYRIDFDVKKHEF